MEPYEALKFIRGEIHPVLQNKVVAIASRTLTRVVGLEVEVEVVWRFDDGVNHQAGLEVPVVTPESFFRVSPGWVESRLVSLGYSNQSDRRFVIGHSQFGPHRCTTFLYLGKLMSFYQSELTFAHSVSINQD